MWSAIPVSDLLTTLGHPGGDLESFWMPMIRTTAWVVFSSEAMAEATFKAVWGREWPPGNRSRLNPQYVSVDEALSKVNLAVFTLNHIVSA